MIAWKPSAFIFVHIPKCAGTSIEQAFIPIISPYRGFKDLPEEARTQHWLPGHRMLQHSKLRRYERNFPLQDYFKFAFVRNPWDRAISQIEYLRSRGAARFSSTSFKENLKIYCEARVNIQGHDLAASQTDYLRKLDGGPGMDYIGRFEALAGDFAVICEKIGLKPAPALPHVFNSQRKAHYRDYYDDESAGWIRKRFAADIEQLQYEF